MDEHAVGLLEFARILDELCGLSVSPPGAALLRAQPILTDGAALDDLLDLSLEFRSVLESGRQIPGFDFPDLGPVIPLLGKPGGQLEGEELALIGRWVLSALKMKRTVVGPDEKGRLAGIASGIPDLSTLSRQIFRIVDREGLLREKQIPELNAIRERIRRHREDADRAVRGLLEDRASRTYWQTTTPTQRDGRMVLPLKSQFKGRVPGIVHEMSASGSTIFIEPLEVVEKNNAIVQEESLYRLEARRILRELTAAVSARKDELTLTVEKVAFLDTLMARARYAIQHSCRRADRPHGSARTMDLREARHPLLGSRVVPVSVAAGPDHRVLIITGPNTGGKTVTLKTVGVLALMNQFGMEIPAAEGSTLPLFDGIFADIGDEQSIEQSLSTFSAHVKNLSAIVRAAAPRSLVLLDELGAGTDPQEGVALAMSLLDHFLATGCIVLATTHHGILKNYGATRPGAQNASMGFDAATLAPTYRVLMGVPGESHALEIARRSGMPGNVLADAFAYLDDERTDISRLVSNLAERHQKLIQAEEEHKSLQQELREKTRTAEEKELSLRQKELDLRRQGLKELRDFLIASRREWEEIREMAGTRSADDFQRLVSGIQARVEEEDRRIEQERESLTPAPSFEVREGMEIVIARTGRRGRVLRRDKGGKWVVETETLRLSLAPGELRPAPAAAGPAVSVSYSQPSTIEAPVFELHLIGARADDALRQVERQIDRALVHGLREFSIVHGKGEGILRTAIHEYLRGLPVVQDFRFSSPEEGGFGKTIVTLKG
jgi:DNA mismatch repair protein MutS2